MSESPPESRNRRRNTNKQIINELVRQCRNQRKLDDLRNRITTVYKTEASSDKEVSSDEEVSSNEKVSSDEENNEMLPIPGIEDISLLETNSEVSTESDASIDQLENENMDDNNNYNNDNDSELHFEDENNDSEGSVEINDANRYSNDEENDDLMIEFENDEQRGRYVLKTLREWALEGGVLSMKKLNDLLRRLRVLFPILPKSYKTLLQTSRDLDIDRLPDGSQMWYKSIRTNLDNMLLDEYLNIYNSVIIDINMDGLPLSKSSKLKVWPILGYLVNTENEPFIIGLYFGDHDPVDIHFYLHKFVNELEDLLENGYIRDNCTYPFIIRNYVLDAPARSLVKRCVSHGGYGACEKCTCVGEYVADRIVYTNLNAPLRTDHSFIIQEDPLHHICRSILKRVDTGMVSQFRLDSFHLVWHGVFKRLWMVWMQWNGPWKLNKFSRKNISNNLNFLRDFCPSDFCRLPRSIDDWKMYKATEERRLCLYDGLLIFRNNLQENVYKNYLLLQAALYILSSPLHVNVLNDFANELLRAFIKHCIELYGKRFVVYNVHSLSHLAQECAEHGSLENFSSFMFENRLKSIKSSLKSGYKPLQQAVLRDLERVRAIKIKLKAKEKIIHLSHRHEDAEEQLPGTHFRCLSIDSMVLRIDIKNCCFCTTDGNVYILRNIVKQERRVMLVCNKFQDIGDFYTYPFPSSRLGIVRVSQIDDERFIVPLHDVHAKCWLMPYSDDCFLCVPLLHTILFQ
ncbi:uncharacterized protein LOC114933620 isoform X1 [Nylanderia fulva]|uniref:uncharacterized protein LOC114933620 isoform X1 n=1 Tax=Nylanderia fulva TaxID=613905 RepID=UPI0010FB5C29|nr:uncharacterized protein LOC114933620 isoform X1 [Nylanderia fulva]